MKKTSISGFYKTSVRMVAFCLMAAGLLFLGACVRPGAPAAGKTFATPEEAVEALKKAVNRPGTKELLAIFGSEGKEILSSGDPVDDQRQREVFKVALNQKWVLQDTGEGRKELVVGYEKWPFPIPLMKTDKGWQFDTEEGEVEVLARRIGRNELAVIQICKFYVKAQKAYASAGRDGKPAGIFAQKVRSTPGKKDGLYWKTEPGESSSPLGDLAARAAAEGYTASADQKPIPLRGYYFRILTKQGPDAPGGEKDYVAGGEMTGGFALVAHPADYGNSGIMTFIVNRDGIVYQRDLGEETAKAAAEMTAYNPGEGWTAVE